MTSNGNRSAQLSHRVVLLIAAAVFINMVDRGNLATAAPLLKDELGLSNSEMGVLLSAFFWVYAPALPLVGWMAHRFDVRVILAAGLALWSVATILTGFAAGFTMLLIARLLLGLGESATYPCSMRLIAQYLPEDQRGRANGFMGTGQALGPSFGTLFGGVLMAGFGWRVIFIGMGLASLFWLIPWYFATRRGMATATETSAGAPVPFARILRQRGLWGTALGLFCLNYSYYFVLSWLPLILVKSRGFSVKQMAVIGAVVYCIHAAFCAVMGAVSDRWIRAGASPNRVRKGLIVAGSLGAAATVALTADADPRTTIFLLGLYGFFSGFTTPMIFAITQTLAGARAAGQWYGLQGAAGQVAGIVAPIITGVIVDRTGQFAWAFTIAAGVLLIGAFTWAFIVPRVEPIRWAEDVGVAQ
jgi:MFS family permease